MPQTPATITAASVTANTGQRNRATHDPQAANTRSPSPSIPPPCPLGDAPSRYTTRSPWPRSTQGCRLQGHPAAVAAEGLLGDPGQLERAVPSVPGTSPRTPPWPGVRRAAPACPPRCRRRWTASPPVARARRTRRRRAAASASTVRGRGRDGEAVALVAGPDAGRGAVRAVHRRAALPPEPLRAQRVPEPGRGRRALEDLEVAAGRAFQRERALLAPVHPVAAGPRRTGRPRDATPCRGRRRRAMVGGRLGLLGRWRGRRLADGDGEVDEALGSGMTPWSVGVERHVAERGRLGQRDGVGASSSRIARLMMKPKATTSSTPARITDGGHQELGEPPLPAALQQGGGHGGGALPVPGTCVAGTACVAPALATRHAVVVRQPTLPGRTRAPAAGRRWRPGTVSRNRYVSLPAVKRPPWCCGEIHDLISMSDEPERNS